MFRSFGRPRGFTLIELLVVIAVIAILAALIFPSIQRTIAQGRGGKCANFLRQIGAASLRYAGENEMTLPVTTHQRRSGGASWSITLQPYAAGTLCFRCPCDEHATRVYSYVLNDFLTPNPTGAPDLDFSKLPRLQTPARTMLFGEASPAYLNSDHFHFSDYYGAHLPPEEFSGQVAAQRHDGAANYLFADGHVEAIAWSRVQQFLTAPGNPFVDPTAPETSASR